MENKNQKETSIQRGEDKSIKRRRVLGRGLKSLFSSTATTGSFEGKTNFSEEKPKFLQKKASKNYRSSYLLNINIENIRPKKNQPRHFFDKDSLKNLGASLKENGFIQPIVVRKTHPNPSFYEIIAGERRWRASGLVGIHKVPCIVLEKGEEDSALFSLIENIQRQDLNHIERAMAFQHLMETQHLTQEKLALKIGMPRASLANYLRLLYLHKDVKEMIIKGDISYAIAKILGKEKDPQKQLKMAQIFVEKKMGIREAKTYQKREQKRLSQKPSSKGTHSNLVILGKEVCQKIEQHTGLLSDIKWKKNGGQLILRFYSNDQLQNIIDLLTKQKNQQGPSS